MQKRILITNDDGYESKGLLALADALKPLGHVTIVAPTTEKSACGHSLTVTKPLKFIRVDDDFFKLDDGTPSDCIYLAVTALFEKDKKPDLVVSGINRGANLGEDITYSGTAGGAMEGTLHGIPSFAVSQYYTSGRDMLEILGYELAAKTAHDLAKKILQGAYPLGSREFINVNIPPITPEECKGYKVTKTGNRVYESMALMNRNPRGEEYYWIGVDALMWQRDIDENSDIYALNQGFVSLTPIQLDMTSHGRLKTLEKWIKSF
ncbi:MAG: 5'/3'-nucleotidase SurE [Campylobacteraceae bacterium]|jgi:5'-nucleotidase|nr:5'/3'-nucleotidase SurE [Campylobacteraceae bacterium]